MIMFFRALFLFTETPYASVTGIVLKVHSIKKAREFLEENNMLGEAGAHRILIRTSTVFGLDIAFTDR